MSTANQSQLKPIPIPPNFPIQWESPLDPQFFWFREDVHFPDQMKSLDFILYVKGPEIGWNQAMRYYGIPGGIYDRFFNTYVYETFLPPEGSPEEIAKQFKLSQEKLDDVMLKLDKLWNKQWLPEIQQHLTWWENYGLLEASMPELVAHFKESYTRLYRLWEIHFLLYFPMILSVSLFEEMYQELFNDSEPLDAYRLLAGVPNKTTQSELAIWQLSQQALDSPEVLQILNNTPLSDVISKLKDSQASQAFLNDFEEYLQVYGRRGIDRNVSAVSWIENPLPVLKNLLEYIKQPKRNLAIEMEDKANLREQAIATARTRLAAYPQPVIAEFEKRLKAAQVGYTLMEDHTYWIDFRGVYQIRCVCMALGQRLRDVGLIQQVNDIFYLTADELLLIHTSDQPAYQSLIEERQHNEKHFATITPPATLGSSGLEIVTNDSFNRAFSKVIGGSPSSTTTMKKNSLSEVFGEACSAGVVRGLAKVLDSLNDSKTLARGEILVTSVATPSWTPLFAIAAAVVTDHGGVLSHSAIVAREYGIPAVLNTGSATAVIQNGQMIEVDGNLGVVRIL